MFVYIDVASEVNNLADAGKVGSVRRLKTYVFNLFFLPKINKLIIIPFFLTNYHYFSIYLTAAAPKVYHTCLLIKI